METFNVQAVNSKFGSGTATSDTIKWDFGDPGSAYNDLVGFNAAHAYAKAGTYTITCSITTPDGHVGVTTKTVVIAADTRNTIYISASGNDNNNGSSASSAIKSIDRLNQLISSNTRVLFQSGGTYNMSANAIKLDGLQHVYIGSYGSGGQPDIFYTGAAGNFSMITMTAQTSGVVVQGLTFDSRFANNNDNNTIPSASFVQGNDIAFIGNTFLNLEDDLNMEAKPTNVLVQDNTSPETSGLNGYFCWLQGSEIAVLGNTVSNSVAQADFRVGGVTDLLVSNNTFGKTTTAGNAYKNTMSVQWINYGYFYGNDLTNGPLQLGPIGDPTAGNINIASTASTNNVVVDSNTFHDSQITISPQTLNSVVRNNVLLSDNNSKYSTAIFVNSTEIGGGFNWQVNGVTIENNTASSTSEDGTFLQIQGGESKGLVFDNNLWFDPNMEMGDNQSALIYNSNDDWKSFSQIKDNVWGSYASENEWFGGGLFYVGSNPGTESGWITEKQLDSQAPASGDVYENVTLNKTYSVQANGFTAGSTVSKT
jgi:hypothetical protein